MFKKRIWADSRFNTTHLQLIVRTFSGQISTYLALYITGKLMRKELLVYQIKDSVTILEEYIHSKLGNSSSKIKFCFSMCYYEKKMTISVSAQDYSNITLTISTDFLKTYQRSRLWDISIASAHMSVLNYFSYLMCLLHKFNHFISETITNVKFNFDSLSILWCNIM